MHIGQEALLAFVGIVRTAEVNHARGAAGHSYRLGGDGSSEVPLKQPSLI